MLLLLDWRGNPNPVSSKVTANSHFRLTVLKVSRGEVLGDVGDLLFWDPKHFRAGKLHEHVDSWKEIVMGSPLLQQSEDFPDFQHFQGFLRESHMTLIFPQERHFLIMSLVSRL